jgi:hypothetical protein
MDLGRLGLFVGVGLLAYVGWSQLREDDTLRNRADEVACMGKECTVELQKKARDAFGWTFSYRTYGEATRAVSVTCARPFWLFGSYRCDVSAIDASTDPRFAPR